MSRPFDTTEYRYFNEYLMLLGTLALIGLGFFLVTLSTACLGAAFGLGMLAISYTRSRNQHTRLLALSRPIFPGNFPQIVQLAEESAQRLQTDKIDIYIVPRETMNAYAFGLTSPQAIMLNQPLLNQLDSEELQFVIGHEMGHIRLGHTWINTVVGGGMAGVPYSHPALWFLPLLFRAWNRMCEYSADRAGMLACNNPQKAESALVKVAAAGLGVSRVDIDRMLQYLEADDRSLMGKLDELYASHPAMFGRIQQLREYAQTSEYERLQRRMNDNLNLK